MSTRPEQELQLLQFLGGLYSRLRGGRDTEQVARSALRDTATFLGASAACLSHVPPGRGRAGLGFVVPDGESWDLGLLTAFFRDERPRIPEEIMLAPLSRRGRKWRVIGLRKATGPFPKGEVKRLTRIARAISDIVHQIDRDRISEVRSRIERKAMEQLRPKDLFYQILHGLRTLTGYDHSSALLISEDQEDALELVAEQIAWRKGKSEKIGLRLAVGPELRNLVHAGEVYGFERQGEEWHDWTDQGASALARLLDYNRPTDGPASGPRERGILCAPVATRDGVVGVLKVATRHAGTLGRYEADLLRRFMPQASVAFQNSRRAETLQTKMLQAQRKNAVADIARGVAHDVNNALGAILPLVQQLQEDCSSGQVDPDDLAGDLAEIERSVQVCRRIFGGMLDLSRSAARGSGQANARRAIDGALAILEDGMKRRGIRCRVDLPEGLPVLPCNQGDLEQVFLNVLANARDAMPRGGELTVRLRGRGASVEALVEDTGCGIPRNNLERIHEPFFTTKPHGNGLGLSICRSILWGMNGKLRVSSKVGEGTRVYLVFPGNPEGQAEAKG